MVGATLVVARRGSPEDAGSLMNGQHPHPRATMKAHPASTQPPSPLRNPGLGLKLMPIGRTLVVILRWGLIGRPHLPGYRAPWLPCQEARLS